MLPEGCLANFQHIADLYALESTMLLKKAHKLSQALISPKTIEKSSAKFFNALFHESTMNALLYYAESDPIIKQPNWKQTAQFIRVVMKAWCILNVKSPVKGFCKLDTSQEPISSITDWKLSFLSEFANFLVTWEESGKSGLSKETFLAVRHTCLALVDCAKYLLEKLEFRYVLLGKTAIR
jgi:hypothetical protein